MVWPASQQHGEPEAEQVALWPVLNVEFMLVFQDEGPKENVAAQLRANGIFPPLVTVESNSGSVQRVTFGLPLKIACMPRPSFATWRNGR